MSKRVRTHLLRVREREEFFGEILVAAAAAGLRVGWLEWEPGIAGEAAVRPSAAADPLPAVRVSVAGREVREWRRLRGQPQLADTARRHFSGCALVLVHGEVEAPLLSPDGAAWRVDRLAPGDGPALCLSATDLVGRLLRPRPFL